MKRIIYLFLVLPLILFSCEKTPVASFSADTNEPEVGQTVFFNNNSHNGEKFEWDFGDGYMSNDRSPSHTFTATGSFEVRLTATSKSNLSDMAVLTINVMVPTLLELEVREYYSQDVIPDASVILFSSVTDWDAQTNKVTEGFTDADGIAVFSNLDSFVYYVDVWEATHDNYTLRNEDVGFIRTPEILPHKINRFIAWVDVAVHTKGIVRGNRDVIIKKLERKASDKTTPAADSGSQDWQELYNRRVGK
jgi:PKD repeat protein